MKNETNLHVFTERLKALRVRSGLTQIDLASSCSVSVSSVAHWESGDNLPSPRNLKQIALLLQCSIPYLLGETEDIVPIVEASPHVLAGNSAVKMQGDEDNFEKNIERWQDGLRRVPVVSWAQAGAAHDYGDLCNQLEEWVGCKCRDMNSFALIIEGDSMEPRFMAGDRVIFAPNSEPRNGNFVVARLKEGHGVLFKRFRRCGSEGGVIRLESLNPDYGPLEYPVSAFAFIYPAVEMHGTLPR